jgi:hypothetical protein
MLVFHFQNAEQNYSMKAANIAFENVSEFRYLEMTVTNQNRMAWYELDLSDL